MFSLNAMLTPTCVNYIDDSVHFQRYMNKILSIRCKTPNKQSIKHLIHVLIEYKFYISFRSNILQTGKICRKQRSSDCQRYRFNLPFLYKCSSIHS